jgi:Zn-dependent protease
MFRSWKLGTLGGVGIYVHSTCLLLVALQLFAPLVAGGWPLAEYRLALYVAVLGCIVLHELGHAWMARRYGIATRDITLYPIGGVASLEGMSEKPSEEFWIALAGPAVSVVIAAILRLLTLILPDWFPTQETAGFQPGYLVCHLALINVGLVVFNLLPAFPMDGGRMLRALLSGPLGRLRATRIAASIGSVLARALGIGGALTGQILLVLVAAFVYFVGNRELTNVQRSESIEQIPATKIFQPGTETPDGVRSTTARTGTLTWEEKANAWVFWEDGRPVHKFQIRELDVT